MPMSLLACLLCFLYTGKISANSEPWLRTLPSFHSLLYFFWGVILCSSPFLTKRWYGESFHWFSKARGTMRTSPCTGDNRLSESFCNNFLALHLGDEIHLQISPLPKIEDTATWAHLVLEKVGIELLCHWSQSQNFLILVFGAQPHIWLQSAACKPTSGTTFVTLHALVLNAQAIVEGWVPDSGTDALRCDQRSVIPSRRGQQPSLSPRPRTIKTTAFWSPAIFIVKIIDFCCAETQTEALGFHWTADMESNVLLLIEMFCLTSKILYKRIQKLKLYSIN